MKKIFLALILPVAFVCTGNVAVAQSTSNSVAPQAAVPSASSEARDQATFEKHTKPVMGALKLDDATKAAKVHDPKYSRLFLKHPTQRLTVSGA